MGSLDGYSQNIKTIKSGIFLLYKDNIIIYITINNFIQYQMVVDIFIL